MLQEYILKAFAGLGALIVLRATVSVLNFIYVAFLRPGKNLKKLGTWAVVTVRIPNPQEPRQVSAGKDPP